MKMNRVLVSIFFIRINKQYDIWIPLNKRIINVISLIIRGVNELNDNIYQNDKMPLLYNKETGEIYDLNSIIGKTDIRNGTELIIV